MISLGGRNILLGGFHDHWHRSNQAGVGLLLAALDCYHYDFVCLMDGPAGVTTAREAEALCPWIRFFPGQEPTWGWGHAVTVGEPGLQWRADNPDAAGVLREITLRTPFVALAHPGIRSLGLALLESGEVDRMLAGGAIRAVEFCNAPAEVEWIRRRVRHGLPVRLVSGWDMHNVVPRDDLPPVLYQDGALPAGHLDSAGARRTVVIADECSLDAIAAAVYSGRSAVDSIVTGELLGDPDTVRFLEDHGYREAVRELDRRRDLLRCAVSGQARAGEHLALDFGRPGTLRLPSESGGVRYLLADGRGHVELDRLPARHNRDAFHLPLVFTADSGERRVFALEVQHPVQLDALPRRAADGRWEIELRDRLPFRGECSLTVDEHPGWSATGSDTAVAARLDAAHPGDAGQVAHVRIDATSAGGVRRIHRTMVNFHTAPRFTGDWAQVPFIPIDRALNAGSGYGSNRPWPGPEQYSIHFQLAWSPTHFHARFRVTDRIHCNDHTGHMIYQGDAVQFGFDPLLSRQPSIARAHMLGCARTRGGRAESWCWHRPGAAAFGPGYVGRELPPGGAPIAGAEVEIGDWEMGLDYQLRIPIPELDPFEPAPGARFGFFVVGMNNNGDGLIDSLRWPEPTPGMWFQTNYWGVISCTE